MYLLPWPISSLTNPSPPEPIAELTPTWGVTGSAPKSPPAPLLTTGTTIPNFMQPWPLTPTTLT